MPSTIQSHPPSRTQRRLARWTLRGLRLVTLACAAAMLLSPNSFDHYHAAILAGLALYRP